MMGRINNLEELHKELAHLKVARLEQEAKIRADFSELKNYLKPSFLLRSLVTPSGDESQVGHVLKNSAGFGAGLIANKLLFRNASWLFRGAAALAVKSLTTGALNSDSIRNSVKGFFSRFRKNGQSKVTL